MGRWLLLLFFVQLLLEFHLILLLLIEALWPSVDAAASATSTALAPQGMKKVGRYLFFIVFSTVALSSPTTMLVSAFVPRRVVSRHTSSIASSRHTSFCTFAPTRHLPAGNLRPLRRQRVTYQAAASASISALSMSAASPPMDTPYYITTPIYYVNDKPHIGHAYTTLACDALARWYRMEGRPVYFLTGTDEHGQKVQQSAEKAGVTPQQYVDDLSESFQDLLQVMEFSNDGFVRTTSSSHKEVARALWRRLEERGQLYLGAYEGWYSVRDECYYTESELIDGKAPTGADVEWVVKEQSYFFKLSDWEEPLLRFYEENPDFIGPQSRRNEVVSFVKGGLKDLSVSRTVSERHCTEVLCERIREQTNASKIFDIVPPNLCCCALTCSTRHLIGGSPCRSPRPMLFATAHRQTIHRM